MAKQLGTTTVNDYEFADTGQSFGIPNMMGAQEAADGSVWCLDNAGNLYQRNPTTGASHVVASGLGSPTIGLVVAADGTAYVTNPSALIKITPDGTKTTLLSGGGVQSLWDVEMGPDGNLYVSDNSAIWRVTPDGQATQFVSGGLINRLQGLAFDSNGNLYALCAAQSSLLNH
jgi:streptogramin lyase